MRRIAVLTALVAVGALSYAVSAQQAPKVVEVEKLKDNLFVLKGGGGNTAVFVQANGITVVDTKNPGWGQPILDKIKGLTNKPITTIINDGRMKKMSGTVILTETMAAFSSACCIRLVRIPSECTRSARETLVPNISVWMIIAESDLRSSTPVRWDSR